jgi:hypothetical protein
MYTRPYEFKRICQNCKCHLGDEDLFICLQCGYSSGAKIHYTIVGRWICKNSKPWWKFWVKNNWVWEPREDLKYIYELGPNFKRKII